jgi:WhiB family redox-sensing transcriptional regulator
MVKTVSEIMTAPVEYIDGDQTLVADRDGTWFERAACRDVDRTLFFEAERESSTRRDRRVRAAKSVCAQCPVRRECLSFALAVPERYGIWGGMTAWERKLIRRRKGPSRRSDRRGP